MEIETIFNPLLGQLQQHPEEDQEFLMTNQQKEPYSLPDRAESKKIYKQLYPEYEQILQEIYHKIIDLAEQADISVTVKYRVKRFEHYCEKLIKLKKFQGDEVIQITDLLGIRVICPFLEDLETIERIILQSFEILEMERKAEQHSFREFGYDSVHFLIKTRPIDSTATLPHSCDACEIQLRTILQEAWAEVEHELVYKSDITIPDYSIRRKLASLNASLTLSDLIFQEIRDDQKEIRRREMKCRSNIEAISCDLDSIKISQVPEMELCSPIDEEIFCDHLPPGKLEKLMLTALESHSNGHFNEAIEIYSILLRNQLEPTICSLVYNHRGMALFALAKYPQGIEDFNRAIETNRDNVRAWINRGLAYRVVGKFDCSLEDYKTVIELSPQSYEGYWGRAQTYYEMKLYSRALSDCCKAIERQPNFKPAQELEKILRRQLF